MRVNRAGREHRPDVSYLIYDSYMFNKMSIQVVLTLSSEGERVGGAHSSEVSLDETLRALGADLVSPKAASARRRGAGKPTHHASTTVEVAIQQ